MKTINTFLVAAVFAAGTFGASAQPAETAPPPGQPVSSETKPADTPPPAPVPAAAAMTANENGNGGIRLNFSNAPLESVLKYLSDAAGFHIIMDTQVRGNVTVMSGQPMSKDEAVDLLNTVLNKNGYAAIRNGQILTIVDRTAARNRAPVKVWNNDPSSIPNNDEVVTQIIPIRFVEAGQLVKDLSPFVSQQATIIANEAGNSVVVTDTQSNIRHLTEIIKAIDSSAEASTEIRTFRLRHANPTDVATLLGGLFPSQNSGTQNPIRFGGGGNRGGGNFGGGFNRGGGPGGFFAQLAANAAGGSGGATDRIRKQTQVIAVADARTQSVTVSAQKDLMDQIEEMIVQIDVPSSRDQKVYVFHLDHGDPQQTATVLQGMFGTTGTTAGRGGTSSSQNSALQSRQQYNANQMGSSSGQSLGTGRSTGVGGGGGGLGGNR